MVSCHNIKIKLQLVLIKPLENRVVGDFFDFLFVFFRMRFFFFQKKKKYDRGRGGFFFCNLFCLV